MPPGTSVLDAARKLGIDIPTMCHYAKLTAVGACRLCLVEIEKVRGLQPACATPVRLDMVVRTDTPDIRTTRATTLEFLLTNHPLDCPVCDKGGECDLQDQVFTYGPDRSRFIETKRHKAKAHLLSDQIIMDQERCVLCRRCIRFLQEWADDVQLGVIERGAKSYVDTFDGEPLDSIFSGNVTNLCPVGALTSRRFRFSARSWELDRADSICNNCGMGCNISLHTKANRLKRVVPRENLAVNDEWLCNRGQFDHSFADAETRVMTPMLREGGELKPASWDAALDAVAGRLRLALEEGDSPSIGVWGSARASNEANYLLQRLARGALRTNNVTLDAPAPDQPRLIASPQQLANSDLVVVVGMDVAEVAPVLELHCRHNAISSGTRFVVLHDAPTHLAKFGIGLTVNAGAAVAVLNGIVRQLIEKGNAKRASRLDELKGWVSAFTPAAVEKATGVSAEALTDAADALVQAGKITVLYGGDHATDETLRSAVTNLTLLTGADGPAFVPADANVIGAADMGMSPEYWPGYQAYTDQRARDRLGKTWGQKRLPTESGLREIATLKTAYVLGKPAADMPEAAFLIVQTDRLEDAPENADVVLPACSFAECEGTYTNLMGRVQVVDAAMRPMGESRPDWWILTQIGQRLGKANCWAFESAGDVFAEIARCVPAYADMTYRSLLPTGMLRKTEPDRLSFAEAEFAL